MDKEERRKLRERVKSNLAVIAAGAIEIKKDLELLPHPRGVFHESLDRKTGSYVFDATNGITASYVENEVSYDITVHINPTGKR